MVGHYLLTHLEPQSEQPVIHKHVPVPHIRQQFSDMSAVLYEQWAKVPN